MTDKDKRGSSPIVRGVFCACVLLLGNGAHAVVTLDGTLGPEGPILGPNYAIPAAVGQTRGANLFHSFGVFSLASDQSATFYGPPDIQNIIGRVTGIGLETGPEVSNIDGLISSDIAGANLFLLNPYGVVFGPNARLDVSGSFFASTADYLRLADGGRFDARDPGGSTLTMAPPAAFGFLGAPAPITVTGELAVPTGNTLGLVGGDITIREDAVLDAFSGRIELAAVASAGEVALSSAGGDLSAFDTLGEISLADVSLSTRGTPRSTSGGTIAIRAGRLIINSAELDSGTFGDTDHPGIGIDIAVRGEFALGVSSDPDAEGALIDSSSDGAGRVGDIRIEAERFTLAGDPTERGGAPQGLFSVVASRSFGSGRGGNIFVNAGELEVGGSAGIVTESTGTGAAGDITVNADAMRVDGTTGFGSLISSSSAVVLVGGNPGAITISARDVLLQGGGADAAKSPLPRGVGLAVISGAPTSNADASGITLTAERLQILDGAQVTVSGGVNSTVGAIRIHSDQVLIAGRESAIVNFSSPSRTAAAGAHVDIEAQELVVRDFGSISVKSTRFDLAANLRIAADNISLAGQAQLSADASVAAGAGNIDITARDRLTVQDSLIQAQAVNSSSGNTTIAAGSLVSVDNSSISTSVLGTSGVGGDLRIEADTILLSGNTLLSATAEVSEGSGGGIELVARDALYMRDSAVSTKAGTQSVNPRALAFGGDITLTAQSLIDLNNSSVAASLQGSAGNAGTLRIAADTVALSGGSTLSATATDAGNAGNIELSARDSLRLQGSTIATEAGQSAGGNITISARSVIHLTDSTITASVQGGLGDGGNIFIDPDFVILNHSRIAADAVGGNGGNVSIVAANFLASADSSITASSTLGVQGNVVIRAPTQDLSGDLAKLPETALDASTRFKSDCAAVGSRFSSFTVSAPSVAARAPAWMPSRYAGIGTDAASPTCHSEVPRSDASLTWAKSAPAKGCAL